MEDFLKKLHIKINPNKLMTYIFYGLTVLITVWSLGKLLRFMVGDPIMNNNVSPYLYSIFIAIPFLGYSFFVNSKITNNDAKKINIFVVTCSCMGIIICSMICTWISSGAWEILNKLANFNKVVSLYPELVAPAIKTLTLSVPFVGIFLMLDYFLSTYSDDDLPKAIPAFCGLDLSKKSTKDIGVFTCENIICKEKDTGLPVVVPEKKRYEAMLVQGATGTGKTATVLLPMSAFDLEKKFFFREYSKKIGYSMLKKGIAYMGGPYNNEFINQNFSLNYLSPKRGMEEQFFQQVAPLIQYKDNATGQIIYRNLGITIVENDGKFISDFVGVAKNFDVEVLSIDPASPETTLSINPFAIDDPAKVASIIGDVLNSMYEDQGGGGAGDPFFTQVTMDAFQNLSILLKEMYPLMHDGIIASLEDMLELLYNFDAVEEMAEEMKKIPELEQKYKLLIKYFEKNFYKPSLNINGYEIPGTRGSGRKDTEKFLYGAITQLNNLIRHPGLKAALCGKDNIIRFDQALEKGHVITACSRKGELGKTQAKAFGMFFILQFQDAVLRRKGNEDSRIPHFIYIDEFPEYINKDMEVMFTLFRKYRCGVTVALQNLSQLEKSGKSYYRETVLANTKTQMVFGDTVPDDSAYWEKAFGTEKKPDSTTSYSIDEDGKMKKNIKLEKIKKTRMDWYKIQNLGFCAVFYKTKDAKGKSVYGKGKTAFLDAKYKEKANTLMFNFEKYMMSKPDNPSIVINSDTSNDTDILMGVDTSTRLSKELKKIADDPILPSVDQMYDPTKDNNDKKNDSDNTDFNNQDFEIIFENDEPKLDIMSETGGAISEEYESPVIRRNDKK